MHFSIPDTQQLCDERGSNYTGFNLHLNGEYHSTLRYKQLHNFNDQIRKLYGVDNVPNFPPKKLFPLTAVQIDERRNQLEKFMQALGQSNLLRTSDLVISFLLLAQQESFGEEVRDVTLSVYLLNNVQTSITVNSSDSYSIVLERICNELCLPSAYISYFSLFLISCQDVNHLSILRKLQHYECPYISQKTIPGSLRIYLMKNYWDLEYDVELMSDPVGLNLLYVQAVSDVHRECIVVHQDTRKILDQLETSGAQKEYLELARQLKYYGFIEFEPCICDFPKPNTRVIINIGMREINFRIRSTEGDIREGTFKVTRMRCWRITMKKEEPLDNCNPYDIGCSSNNIEQNTTELAFEYLLAKNKLQWITIISDQAILMSNLLQSIIDELVIKRSHDDDRHSKSICSSNSFYYMRRDGSSQITSPSISSSELDSNSSNGSSESRSSTRRLSDKISSVSMKVMGKSPFVENDAFEGIGDDDL